MEGPDNTQPLIEFKRVAKVYGTGEAAVHALAGIDLRISAGEFVAIMGTSGSGKSTLLNILGGLDRPTAGVCRFKDHSLTDMSESDLTMFRREHVGFVFQFYNLIPSLTARENVALVTEISRHPMKPADALALVGLADRMEHFPAELSGGEQQRVAIARALANRPGILFADEPTGNLDPKTSRMVFAELLNICRSQGVAALIATHNLDLASHMDRVVLLHEGKLHEGTDIAAEYQSL